MIFLKIYVFSTENVPCQKFEDFLSDYPTMSVSYPGFPESLISLLSVEKKVGCVIGVIY